MVLYILTSYSVLGIVCLNQLLGARHRHISYQEIRFEFCGLYLCSKGEKKFSRCLKLWDFLLLIRIDLFHVATIELKVLVRFNRKVPKILELEPSFLGHCLSLQAGSVLQGAIISAVQLPLTSLALWLRLKHGPSSTTFFLDLQRFRKDNFRRFKFGEEFSFVLRADAPATKSSSHDVNVFDRSDFNRRKFNFRHVAVDDEVGGVDERLLMISAAVILERSLSLKASESQRLRL